MSETENKENNDQLTRLEMTDKLVDTLLVDYKTQRDSLVLMIGELEDIKKKVNDLFPEVLDKRSVIFFQERVKAITELFKAVLDIRKEIIKSLKDEMEFRRKVSRENEKDDFDDEDIRKLAKRVESLGSIVKTVRVKDEPKGEVVDINSIGKGIINDK